MSTKISYQTWSGGSGMGDPEKLIGYCKEEPKEVLEKVYQKYYIYHYKNLYRPVDYDFPNNCSGLVIREADNNTVPGCTITGCLEDLDLSIAYNEELSRTKETYKEGIESAIKWHTHSNKLEEKYKIQIDEVREVILKS